MRLSIGPLEALTGAPAKMPLLNIGTALGLRPVTLMGPPTPRSPAQQPRVTVNPVSRTQGGDDQRGQMSVTIHQPVPNQQVSVASSSVPSVSSSLLPPPPGLTPQLMREVGSEAMSYARSVSHPSGGVNVGASTSHWSPSQGPVEKRARLDSDPVQIRRLDSSSVFRPVGIVKAEEFQSETLSFLENRHQFFKKMMNDVAEVTGTMSTGDLPKHGEFVQISTSRSPIDRRASPTIGNVDPKNPNKPKVCYMGDSTLCLGQFTDSGNTFLGTFQGRSDEVHELKYPQSDWRALLKEQEFDACTYAISGLSAVFGDHKRSPDELKTLVYGEFGLPPDFQFNLLNMCIGSNDMKFFVRKGKNLPSAEDVPPGSPTSINEALDQLILFMHGLARAFNCPVAWLSPGCPGAALPSQETAGAEPLKVYGFPANRDLDYKAKFNSLHCALIAHHKFTSNGVFEQVESDDSPNARFCIFAVAPLEQTDTASGTGHPSQKNLGNFFSNLLNCTGVLLCKLADNNNLIKHFIKRAGVSPRWKKNPNIDQNNPSLTDCHLLVDKHSKLEFLRPELALTTAKLDLKRQSEWPHIICSGVEQVLVAKKVSEVESGLRTWFKVGQLCRIKIGQDEDARYEAGLVLGVLQDREKYLVSSLWTDQAAAYPWGKISCFKRNLMKHDLKEISNARALYEYD